MNEYITNLISRNVNNLNLIPEYYSSDRESCLRNIKWARDLNARLNNLDYDIRDKAIKDITDKLNSDYAYMSKFQQRTTATTNNTQR